MRGMADEKYSYSHDTFLPFAFQLLLQSVETMHGPLKFQGQNDFDRNQQGTIHEADRLKKKLSIDFDLDH
jgi:hypothetical protein